MLQVQDIYDDFAAIKRDVSDITEEDFCRWTRKTANYIYDKVKRIDFDRFAKTQSYTPTTDPYESALPSDFKDLNQTGAGLFYYDTGTLKVTDQKLGITGYGSSDEGYYLAGSKVVFTGITTKSYYMRYTPKLTPITDLDHYFSVDTSVAGAAIVDDEDLDSIVRGIDVLYEQWESDPNNENIADQRYVRAIGDIFDGFSRTPQISKLKSPFNGF